MRTLFFVSILFLLVLVGCNNNVSLELEAQNSKLSKEVALLETQLEELNNKNDKLLSDYDYQSNIQDLQQEEIIKLREENLVLNQQILELNELLELAIDNSVPVATTDPSSSTIDISSEVITSNIDGTFNGWEGETVFKLMNGQVWQQDSYHYHYHYSYMPQVMIYKSGTRYMMQVDGVNHTIYVKRLK